VTMIDDQMADPLGSVVAGRAGSARQTVNDMIEAGLLDDLMDRVDTGGLMLTGEGGLLPELVKAVLERGLAAELTGHLGYEKNDPAGRGSPNSRNGHSPKTLATEVGTWCWRCRGTWPGRSSRGWCRREHGGPAALMT
jgi:putative transposase